jgi:hypothetical protein
VLQSDYVRFGYCGSDATIVACPVRILLRGELQFGMPLLFVTAQATAATATAGTATGASAHADTAEAGSETYARTAAVDDG